MRLAACVGYYCHCLPRAKMVWTMRGCLTARSQAEGTEEPEMKISGHGAKKTMLPNMLSAILSSETLWNMVTEAFIHD